MLKDAKWIWIDGENKPNSYVEFIDSFVYDGKAKVKFEIACDSRYVLYIGGKLAYAGQYSDYPEYKVAESYDITKFLAVGENKLAIMVWYKGRTSQCYRVGNAGLIYQAVGIGKILCKSGEGVKCRYNSSYCSEDLTELTSQLGFSFNYDATKEDNFFEIGHSEAGFVPAIEAQGISKDIHLSAVEKTVLKPRIMGKICQQGEFLYEDIEPKSLRMMESLLAFRDMGKMSGKLCCSFNEPITLRSTTDKGVYFVVDLLSEEAGFVDFHINLPCEADIDIGFGEHIIDGRVRCDVGGRHFIMSYHGKKGDNEFSNMFLRIGCRYLQFFVHATSCEIIYAGLRPTDYPVNIKKFECSNILRQRIYDTSVKTLQLCMHEHYEDTPWREQGLYTMDSRNQMIFGYCAFGETRFARANLILMTKGLRKDNLLDITFPTEMDMTLPYFSFVYPLQVYDYTAFSQDKTLAKEVFPTLTTICDSALKRRLASGLVPDYDKPNWNFYEWQPGYSGHDNYGDISLIHNSMLSLALLSMAKICESIGESKLSTEYLLANKQLNQAIFDNFYDYDSGLFVSYIEQNAKHYSQLGCSLAILCGAAGAKAAFIAGQIVSNDTMTKATLSMALYKYEALRQVNSDKYSSLILDEIDCIYSEMLYNGATTFWETILGDGDFDRAGSLCHGWSAVPILYYHLFDKESQIRE